MATAANTYISGSQFTFKWNFNIGERSHTESLIYMKPVLRREEQCTVGRDKRGRKLQETYLFSQLFIPIWMQWTKRRGCVAGGQGRSTLQALPASQFLGPHDWCFGLELSSSTARVVPTSGLGELFFSGQMGGGASYR